MRHSKIIKYLKKPANLKKTAKKSETEKKIIFILPQNTDSDDLIYDFCKSNKSQQQQHMHAIGSEKSDEQND